MTASFYEILCVNDFDTFYDSGIGMVVVVFHFTFKNLSCSVDVAFYCLKQKNKINEN